MYRTLISVEELQALPADNVILLDCRFQLDNTDYGRDAWLAGHLPGAQYLHLDECLSGVKTGQNGRHPLPQAQALAAELGLKGVGEHTQVIAYDDGPGQYAARVWWLLRWLGHEAVAVLNGGLAAWKQAGGELSTDVMPHQPAAFAIRPSLAGSVEAAAVLANLNHPAFTVVDARSAERYRGQGETLDPVGGHIPGARNRFFMDNLDGQQRFKTPEALRAEWQAVLGQGFDPISIVHQCGSGVTACHNLLAMEYAGLTGSRLYPGSWSEWCSDPARPVSIDA